LGGIIDAPESDEKVRAELNARAKKEGAKALYGELKAVDEASALNISENDVFRIIRALEIYMSTGLPVSELRKSHSFKDNEFSCLKIGIDMDRKKLYTRIEQRVDKMVAAGLEDEVRGLIKMGCTKDMKPLSAIGYKQMMMYLAGEISHDEAVRLIKRDTKRYAKRQLTWFKKEKDIVWFDAEGLICGDEYASIKEKVTGFLGDI
jgi:tRNA dimethylallyltransferase